MTKGVYIKICCVLCKKEVNANAWNRHCVSHDSNPDRWKITIKQPRVAWNKGKTLETSDSIKQISETRRRRIESGECKPTGFANPDYYNSDAHKASASKGGKRGGGYREGAGKSKKFHVPDSYGKIVCLQSTYELECSQILNGLGVNWIRPKALKYDEIKNYFADFYLPDYDIWLDPKNSFKAECDKIKIEKVITQNNVKLFILLKHQLTEEYISKMLQ